MKVLFYPRSENKGADQLRSYHEADLRLFWHMQNVGFLITRLKCIKAIKSNFCFMYTNLAIDDSRD